MKNEIKKKIEISEEVLSVLPKNNEKNTISYISEANKIYANFNNIKIQLEEEISQRSKAIENIVRDDEPPVYNFDELINKIWLLSEINTPYEKLDLDVMLYNLSKYYKINLKEVNQNILNAIAVFKKVGIELKEKDFFYDEHQREYMREILLSNENSLEDLKSSFESLYWKNPNIISHIQFNFRSLYNKNKKIFDKYIKSYVKETKQTSLDIIKEYKDIKISNDLELDKNSKRFLNKFIDGSLDIKDYSKENVTKLLKELCNCEIETENRILFNLNESLKEYKIYLKYSNIINSIKEELKAKGKEKPNSSKKLKEISKLEKKLSKLNNKKVLEIEETTEKIKTLYSEFDEIYYKENLYKNLNQDSKILDAINFLISYYGYFIKLSKKEKPEISIDELDRNLEELRKFVLSPYNNVINNLNILGDYNVPMIIMDKYKLYNINITLESLGELSLEDLIKKTETICNYYKINNLNNLNMDKISDYIKLKKLLKNIN